MKFPKISIRRPSVGAIIFWVIAISLGVVTMIYARQFITCWTITNLPGMAPSSCGNANSGTEIFNPEGTPIATVIAPTPEISAPVDVPAPEWDGGSRVNLLFIGVDARDINERAPRSDTMILFTIDPVNKTAGMLSIPRDMWVNIPGSGYGRINTAYSIGVSAQFPGGGPGLAMKTVSQFLGVPVDYYAQVDFNTFVEMVDQIGGIDLWVKERIILDPVGPGMDKVVITPGYRHLVGWKALAYARTRKQTEGGDVDRAQRQQDVIFAIMDKVLSPDYFPTFVKQASVLYSKMSQGIHTNLAFEDGLKLAVLLQSIPRENIKTGIIDYTMIELETTDGEGQPQSVSKPIPDDIRLLRDEIFLGGATSPVMVGGDPLELAKAENPSIRIVNGSFAGDYGQRTANYLVSMGLNAAFTGNINALDRTVIVMYAPTLHTMNLVMFLLGLNGATGTNQIRFEPNPGAGADIEIRIGNDAVNNNRIP